MSDESMVAAVLAHNDDVKTLRERIGHGPVLTADELSKAGRFPPDLLTRKDGLAVDIGRAEILHTVLLAYLEARQAVEEKAATLLWLGSPTSDFQSVGSNGYARHYEQGSVYWTPTFGAHEVHGAIRDFYFSIGGPRSYLGFPQTDELSAGDVRYSNFQGGTIQWTSGRGIYMTPTYSPTTERYQTGIYLNSRGTGFTPGGRVSIWIINDGAAPKSFGSTYAGSDGRFGIGNPYSSFIWFRPGDHANTVARAIDERTGQSDDYPLSYSVQ